MRRNRSIVLMSVLASCGAEDAQQEARLSSLPPELAADTESTGGGVVYFTRTLTSADGEVRAFEEAGTLDLHTWQRVARPWTYLDEPDLYDEIDILRIEEDGETSQLYGVVRVPNESPPDGGLDDDVGNPQVDEDVSAWLGDGLNDNLRFLALKLRGVPEWNIPLVPDDGTFPLNVLAQAEADRQAALEGRQAEFSALSEDVRTSIEAAGGEIVDEAWSSGWLTVRIGPDGGQQLVARDDLARVVFEKGEFEPLAINLEEMRAREASDIETYWSNGYYGQRSGGTAMKVAVVEDLHINDEACHFGENGGCGTERLKKIYECPFTCVEATKAAYDYSTDLGHGHMVTSLLGADYTQDQADGFDVCDPDCTPTSCDHEANGFEERASGMAKEVNIHYYDMDGSDYDFSWRDAFECAHGVGTGCSKADVISNSNARSGTCDPANLVGSEDELENAYDDGVLIVSGIGNETLTGCTARSPSTVPKVLSVAGLDLASTSDYGTSSISSAGFSGRGGADIMQNGNNRAGALAIADLAAPSEGITYSTASGDGSDPDPDPKGCVDAGGVEVQGTSAATPMVAGAAAVLKARSLDAGNTSIGNPGRLFATMLLMGDRAQEGGGKRTAGTDNLFGFGRLKMRLIKSGAPSTSPGAIDRRTYTFTSSTADKTYIAFGGPMATGAELAKCVALQHEDMSNKSDISRFRLKARVRNTSGGSCSVGAGSASPTRTNSDYDNKKMVAFEDSATNLEGRCLEVVVDRSTLSTAGATTVTVVCGYFSELDDVPN